MFKPTMLAIASMAAAPVNAQLSLVSEGAYTPPDTHQWVLHSQTLDRDMLIVVAAPSAGGPAMRGQRTAGERLPAIYALDLGWGIAGPIGQMMSGVTAIPATYVVSIGYTPGADRRETDLLFEPVTENGRTIGGGGAKFEAFLTQELRPYLEQRYPLDPSKAILFGHSFGGLFVANVLARKPDAFGGYIIASPSVSYAPDVVQRVAKAAPAGAGRRVFVSAGENESYGITAGATAITDALSGSASTFKTDKHIYTGEGHISYYARMVPDAFAYVLPSAVKYSTSVKLAGVAMERVSGTYAFADGRLLNVILRDGKLFVQMTGITGEAEIMPDSENRFFIAGYDTTVVFDIAQPGPASAVSVKVNGVEMRALRK